MSVSPNNAWDRLVRAMRPIDPTNQDGPWSLILTGTVNTVGGGQGGTSMVDNNPFTPGGTSITPAGGYVGGRSIASGNAGAIGLSPSGAVLVHVIAGGAGGGLAQLQVVGTNNSDFANVGYPSGGSPTFNSVPVIVMNQQAGGGFATVGVYGSVSILGSVNIGGQPISMVGSVGATQFGAPWSVVGSAGVTPLSTFTVALDKIPTVNLGLGTVNVGNVVGIFGSVSILGSVNLGGQPISVVGSVNATNLGGSVGVTQITSPWVVDPRGGLTATTWAIQASGGTALVASMSAGSRIYLYGIKLITSATVDVAFQSPSGTYLEGSQRLLPGAGFAENAPIGTPLLSGAAASGSIFLNMSAAAVVGGIARGWVGP